MTSKKYREQNRMLTLSLTNGSNESNVNQKIKTMRVPYVKAIKKKHRNCEVNI